MQCECGVRGGVDPNAVGGTTADAECFRIFALTNLLPRFQEAVTDNRRDDMSLCAVESDLGSAELGDELVLVGC